MISTATGMIVTRSASEGTLNEDVKVQILSQPRVLLITGLVILTMCVIPGAPIFQIAILGIILIALGFALIKAVAEVKQKEEIQEMQELLGDERNEASYYRNIDNVYELLGVEPIEMEFGYSLLPLVDESIGGSFIDRIVIFRKQFALEMGVVIPTVRLRDNGLINPNQYLIKIKGEEVARGEVLVD
jgi:flagellar biosynthesis protein FlhA